MKAEADLNPEEWDPHTVFANPFNVVSPEYSRTYYAAQMPHGIVFSIVVDSTGELEPGATFFLDRDALCEAAGDGYQLIEGSS